ncbi:MAG TPA: energy coupling factor transporter S component ThiW [Bacillota bacterium]|nr:energy coupling factor transporter S component ThiW [Bacillota bacterium]
MSQTKRLTLMALLVAIGTIFSNIFWVPAGVAKAFPIQHAVNVTAAILLGPGPGVFVAFAIGLLRNLLGTGTLLAFPGGMIGAFLAGVLYQTIKRHWAAPIGEVIGTGIVGSLISVPFAKIFLGKSMGALAFIPSFLSSSFIGALIGLIVVKVLIKSNVVEDRFSRQPR